MNVLLVDGTRLVEDVTQWIIERESPVTRHSVQGNSWSKQSKLLKHLDGRWLVIATIEQGESEYCYGSPIQHAVDADAALHELLKTFGLSGVPHFRQTSAVDFDCA